MVQIAIGSRYNSSLVQSDQRRIRLLLVDNRYYLKASNEIVMKDETKIPLATRKKEEFMAYLEADA